MAGAGLLRRVLVAAIAVAIIACIAAIYLILAIPSPKPAVRVGTLMGGLSSIDLVEFYKLDSKHGFRLQVIRFSKTLDLANALAKGEIDVAIIPAEFVAKLLNMGYNIKIIAVDFMQNQAVVAQPGLNARSLRDLIGCKLGVFTPTGTFAMFRAYVETLLGENVNKLFTIVDMPPAQLVQAFARGDVDAVVLWEPLVSKLVVEYGGVVVAEFRSLWLNWSIAKKLQDVKPVMIVYAARGDFVEKHTELVRKLLEARLEAARMWNKDFDKAFKVLNELYGLGEKAARLCWKRVRMVEDKSVTVSLERSILAVWRLAWEGGYITSIPRNAREAFWHG